MLSLRGRPQANGQNTEVRVRKTWFWFLILPLVACDLSVLSLFRNSWNVLLRSYTLCLGRAAPAFLLSTPSHFPLRTEYQFSFSPHLQNIRPSLSLPLSLSEYGFIFQEVLIHPKNPPTEGEHKLSLFDGPEDWKIPPRNHRGSSSFAGLRWKEREEVCWVWIHHLPPGTGRMIFLKAVCNQQVNK